MKSRSIILPLLLSLACVATYGQSDLNRYLTIPFGYDHDNSFPGKFGLSELNFRSNTIDTNFLGPVNELVFGRNNGSYFCDTNGYPLLMSNGCQIFTMDIQPISDEFLFPGSTSDYYCNTVISAYPTSRGGYFLEGDSNDDRVYYLGTNMNLDDLELFGPDTLAVWTLDKTPQASYRIDTVVKTAMPIMKPGVVGVTYNAAGDGWWVTMPGWEVNEMRSYEVIEGRIMDTVISPVPIQIPLALTFESTFSMDGDRYAFGTQEDGLWVFDFDKETGELFNFQQIDMPNTGNDTKGVILSPDGNLAYVTADTLLYQVELNTGVTRLIANHLSYAEDGWPVAVGQLTMGPDCRIYVAPGSATWYAHVIHNPNEIGQGCNFQARGLRTPSRISFAFPTAPNYRREADCLDIEWPFTIDTVSSLVSPLLNEDHQPFLSVGPSPGQGDLYLRWELDVPSNTRMELALFDALGRPLRNYSLTSERSQRLTWQETTEGTFFWQLLVDGQVRQVGKLLR